ncbi:uncharacterized protein LOC128474048 isoform X2 [Spea bombifrons]|uniref:uncharacterized protein LOC128474048 isoform X2 n=1 Tax=Spea bombifrons TaxID=233779 RepID=UPI00234A12A0|nr:uncharacterized protein LOC128474048 isoform X2 [Spea bombifrons]
MTKHKSEVQMNSTSGVKCDSAEQHARPPAGKGTSQSQPGNFPILKCTPADQKTSFALGKNTLGEPLSTYSTNGKVSSVPQSRIIPNLECMVKTFLKEESQSVEVKQLVSKMKEVVNSTSKTISLKTPERRDGHHNGKEPPGASTSQTRPEDVEAEATSLIMEPGSRQDSRKYKDSSTQTSVAEACADESSLDFSTNNVNLLVQYKTMKSQIFNLGASGIENGAYEKFWNVCRKNNCLKFLLANISCSMKIIVKKIESGQAKEQDYEQAFAFLLGSRCLEDVVSKETQEIQARIESIDKEKEELSSKIMFLKNLLS